MGALKLIHFHLSMFIRGFRFKLQELINPNFEEELMAEFEEMADSLPQTEKDEIVRTVKAQYERRMQPDRSSTHAGLC